MQFLGACTKQQPFIIVTGEHKCLNGITMTNATVVGLSSATQICSEARGAVLHFQLLKSRARQADFNLVATSLTGNTFAEQICLCTELMTGGSLDDAFRLPQEFTVRRSLEIAIDTARGLAYMHNKKPNCIIHRDLKPGNLMISGSAYHGL